MKVQMSLNDALVDRLDQCAADNYLTRSAMVTIALTQYLTSQELTKAVKDVAVSIRKVADTGVLDSDTAAKLEQFETMVQLLGIK